MDIVLLLSITAGSLGISELLHRYVNNEYVKAYKKIAEENNLNVKAKENEVNLINETYMNNLGLLRLYPVLNVIITIIRVAFIKRNIEYIESHPEIFFQELAPTYIKEQEEWGVIEDGNKKEYFVGYYNYENKPLTIFFDFDGQDLNILDSSSKTFLSLEPEEQYNQLLYILYAIMIDQDKDFIKCNSIYEIYNNSLKNTLLDKFENNIETFQVLLTDEIEYKLIRNKPKK